MLDRDTRDERPPTSSAAMRAWCSRTPTTSWWQASSKTTAFCPENLGVPTDQLRQRVADALADVGLQGFDKRETAALSGGQKQRVAIAGVLAMEPAILILDEATAMLDPRGRKGLMRVCRELHDRGMTVVMITHFMEEAAQADRVIVLEEGRVACDGTPQDVL
ncbi:MAG: ATP-binding cassette domain-containing protein, partial [Eggerthella lenta]